MEYSFQLYYLCSVNKKDNILKAALKLFVEQGEQSTSMKWIAKEAKCGIGTMYNYFQSKDELISKAEMTTVHPVYRQLTEYRRMKGGATSPL